MTTPCVKLSEFGVLGLNNDVAVMTDCQYGGRAMYMVTYQSHHDDIVNKLDSLPITRCDNLNCITHFDLTGCSSLHSEHLEQLAIVCPDLQRLNLQKCNHCLKSIQGLQTIASHCHNLQGLSLLGICVLNVKDHIKLWEILSAMKLTHLAVQCCVLIPVSEGSYKKILGNMCDYKRNSMWLLGSLLV